MVSTSIRINKYGMSINETTPPDENDGKPIRLTLRGFGNKPNSKAKKWVDSIYAKLPKNPLDSKQVCMVYGQGEDQQIALFELKPSMSDPDAAYIEWFQAYPQKQGVGRKAMGQLQELARAAGIKLILTAWKHGQVPEKALNKFYQSMGFKAGKSREGMVWDPSLDEAATGKDNLAKIFREVSTAFLEGYPSDAIEIMFQNGLTVHDSPAFEKLFEANINKLAALVIQELKQGDADAGIIESIRNMIEDVGIMIPNDKIADYLYNSMPLINKTLRRLVSDGMLDNAISNMIELNEWGLSLQLDDFIDPDEQKDQIIRMMLQMMKKRNNRGVAEVISALKDIDVDWPEFAAFEKSLSATKLKEDLDAYDDKPTRHIRHARDDIDDDYADPKKKKKIIRTNPLKYDPPLKDVKYDPDDDGIRESSVTKHVKGLGVFIMTGHFRDRLRQRKIDPADALGLIERVFKDKFHKVQNVPYGVESLIVDDRSTLGIIMLKQPLANKDGKTEAKYIFKTAHPRYQRYSHRYVIRESDDLNKPTPSIEELAVKYNVPVHDVLRELKKGVEVETEHTSKLHVAREIALDHLSEDLYYYVKLDKMETGINEDDEQDNLDMIRLHPFEIKYVRNPSEAVQLAAVTAFWQTLEYIKNPTEKVKIAAILKNGSAIRYVKQPASLWSNSSVKSSVIDNFEYRIADAWGTTPGSHPSVSELIEDILVDISVLRKKGCPWPELDQLEKLARKPSRAILMKAMEKEYGAAGLIYNGIQLDRDMKLAAIKHHPTNVKWIADLDGDMQLIAVRANGAVIGHLANPDPSIWNDEEAKHSIIKALLKNIKSQTTWGIKMLRNLRRGGCEWPELDAVEKSLRAEMRYEIENG